MRRELVVIAAALVAVLLTGAMGLWQLDRAAQKLELQAALDARVALTPLDAVSLARDPATAESQQYRRVSLHGRWLQERTVFLDNRPLDGRVGFVVVTPLALEDGKVVLVQRGWLPRNFGERAVLAEVTTPPGRVAVEGTVALRPPRLFEFSSASSGAIRQNLDLPSFARETGLDLLPLVVVQQESADGISDGLVRRWPPPATDVQKHHGYAFQWFALAAVIIVLYVWHRLIRPRFRRT